PYRGESAVRQQAAVPDGFAVLLDEADGDAQPVGLEDDEVGKTGVVRVVDPVSQRVRVSGERAGAALVEPLASGPRQVVAVTQVWCALAVQRSAQRQPSARVPAVGVRQTGGRRTDRVPEPVQSLAATAVDVVESDDQIAVPGSQRRLVDMGITLARPTV